MRNTRQSVNPLRKSLPDEPSQREIDNHSLTHEPFRTFVFFGAHVTGHDRDPHPTSSHENVGHSLISLDFG